jgi:hypothetical protein
MPPEMIARGLLDFFVRKEPADCSDFDPYHRVPERLRDAFVERISLYREALVLMALTSESKRNTAFAPALHSYEGMLFGTTPTQPSLEKLAVLKAAMVDLSDLFNTKGRESSWSMQWFRGFGYDATNPIDLFMLSTGWLRKFTTIIKVLRDFEPFV